MSSNSVRISADIIAVSDVMAPLQANHQDPDNGATDDAPAVPEDQLWAHKRAQQQHDIASITAGQSTNDAMSWFSGGRARRAKAVNSPL